MNEGDSAVCLSQTVNIFLPLIEASDIMKRGYLAFS